MLSIKTKTDKALSVFICVLFSILVINVAINSKKGVIVAFAEDEKSSSNEKSSSSENYDEDDDEKIETITTVEYPEPRVEVRKNIQTITLDDSDGDGIIDEEDPHPNVAEIYIVKDDNLNGIVDKYENEN